MRQPGCSGSTWVRSQCARFCDAGAEVGGQAACGGVRRDVVERRVYTVTGTRPAEEDVERLIETGESETIFQKAILEQGRGQVYHFPAILQIRPPTHCILLTSC